MERKSITIEGKIISYHIAGDGKAIVLLHGFGADSSIWNSQAEFLSKNYLVIVPDLPGISTSELISDVSMEGLADVVRQIAEAEELDDIVLIGHSMGGYATLAFAEKHPEMLSGFGLFHSSAGADNEEKKASRQKGIEFVQKHGAVSFLENTAPKMFGATTKNERTGIYENFMNKLPGMSNEAVIDYYEAMMQRPDRTDVLKSAKVPVLFIYGREDEIIDLENTIKQSSLPSVSSVNILNKSGHLGMIEEPEEANKLIEDFLSDI
ncbi:alpha/beta fold hydrolase [Niabella aquatica]